MPDELHCVGGHFRFTLIQQVWMFRAECGASYTSKGVSALALVHGDLYLLALLVYEIFVMGCPGDKTFRRLFHV